MFRAREGALLHLLVIRYDRLLDQRRKMGILLNKARHEFFKHAQQIMGDQYLPVAEYSGPDTDGRNGNRIGNYLRQLSRNTFKHKRKNACIGKGLGIMQQTAGRLQIPALDPVTA